MKILITIIAFLILAFLTIWFINATEKRYSDTKMFFIGSGYGVSIVITAALMAYMWGE